MTQFWQTGWFSRWSVGPCFTAGLSAACHLVLCQGRLGHSAASVCRVVTALNSLTEDGSASCSQLTSRQSHASCNYITVMMGDFLRTCHRSMVSPVQTGHESYYCQRKSVGRAPLPQGLVFWDDAGDVFSLPCTCANDVLCSRS